MTHGGAGSHRPALSRYAHYPSTRIYRAAVTRALVSGLGLSNRGGWAGHIWHIGSSSRPRNAATSGSVASGPSASYRRYGCQSALQPVFRVLHRQIGERRAFPQLALEQLDAMLGRTVGPALALVAVGERLHGGTIAVIAARPFLVASAPVRADAVRDALPSLHQRHRRLQRTLVVRRVVMEPTPPAGSSFPRAARATRETAPGADRR